MLKYLLTTFITFILLSAFAQDSSKLAQLSIFYKTNEWQLTEDHKKEIDNFLRHLPRIEVVRVSVQSYTDSVDDDGHNATLSRNRATAVKDYLLGKGIKEFFITARAGGEVKEPNDTEEQRQQNRRTDIVIAYKEKPEPPNGDPCRYDTTITMPNGTLVTFNK